MEKKLSLQTATQRQRLFEWSQKVAACSQSGIKPFVIDRKNFLFANTPGGAKGSAVVFSLIQTALNNKLDPWRYLTWVMKTVGKTENADALLPWNAPPECSAK